MSIAQHYAAALKELNTEKAAENVILRMRAKGHLSLLPEVVRILKRDTETDQTIVVFAKEEDKKHVSEIASKVGGDEDRTKIKIDPRIVDGYVARKKGKLVDASIRKSLVTIYQKAVGQI